ncbi:MAG: preprotein translocase subunit SecE [Candidatus Doudnabacteria bacterium RIFCSPHIGHO2_01_FULL_50_11]|uniref:Protein translocase subunit SecE n=1 Tax=Candidatus Doudnabacteria bacterium RIFCSPHIGHO2_01_FULL_50_11 TaxID=1817828 RepID=A0A1F5PLX2_9BACT|nr:MAG: preprotein translocase subunit SecE [Candidatus Doudnabacteria bacterium RIFCSPHIGHO2_01_FULL_50_11]HLC44331.1 preprotein translocase subunit SecE [Patescibacteria group bacterium]
MGKIIQFLREARTELIKVVWPSRRETAKMTLLVIIFSLTVALFLGAVDLGLTKLLELVFQ